MCYGEKPQALKILTHPYIISLVMPTGGYVVNGTVEDKLLSILVDIGAAVCLIQKETQNEICPHVSSKLKP